MNNLEYQEFLSSKKPKPVLNGFSIAPESINPKLYLFQRDIVIWALRLGKAAIFANVGLGKTGMQLEWARHVNLHTDKPVLVLAPLAVSAQTIREGVKFGIEAVYRADSSSIEITDKIIVTNYERLDKFQDFIPQLGGIVLDESSILKNFTGKTKRSIIAMFKSTPYKLACSATPAPNDHMELGNHADFLDIMASNEMLSRWFENDTMTAGNYHLKPHGEASFWEWITAWAVCITKPSDLGLMYHMDSYNLPRLNIVGHYVAANEAAYKKAHEQGRLLPDTAPSSTELGRVKRLSLDDRVEMAKEIVASIPENDPILIWCELNDEADALRKAFPEAIEVRGSDSPEKKTEKLLAFTDGKYRILITKASIAGLGMNWQHCNQPIFFSLDFSFESFYQAKGRNHRYGQEREVFAHIIYSELEGNVVSTLERKQVQFEEMQKRMASAMTEHGLFRDYDRLGLTVPKFEAASGKNWTLYLGDCVPVTKTLPDNSIDLSVYSPPFSNLYIYSDSEADMGNAANDEEFFAHYEYLIKELYRVTAPGRLSVVHCKDLPAYMNRDGAAGLVDFPGRIIKAHEAHGWQYHSRVTIWKDPVIEMQRTKNHGLLHKNFVKESNAVRQGMPDYLVVFRKYPLEGQEPVKQKRSVGDYIGTEPPTDNQINVFYGNRSVEDNYSIAVWQRYASPVWFDIDQTNVLNYQMARDTEDSKHICPLQLDVIARSVDLWSNRGDVVYSPFAGIGSEGFEALKLGRKFMGVELKEGYWNHAQRYLKEAELAAGQRTLFDLMDEQALGK